MEAASVTPGWGVGKNSSPQIHSSSLCPGLRNTLCNWAKNSLVFFCRQSGLWKASAKSDPSRGQIPEAAEPTASSPFWTQADSRGNPG